MLSIEKMQNQETNKYDTGTHKNMNIPTPYACNELIFEGLHLMHNIGIKFEKNSYW